jgi:hypothetical protein
MAVPLSPSPGSETFQDRSNDVQESGVFEIADADVREGWSRVGLVMYVPDTFLALEQTD